MVTYIDCGLTAAEGIHWLPELDQILHRLSLVHSVSRGWRLPNSATEQRMEFLYVVHRKKTSYTN